MQKHRITCFLLTCAMVLSLNTSASAKEYGNGYAVTDIPRVIYDNEADMGTLPPITTGYYYENSAPLAPLAFGEGEVITRIREWETASGGLYRTDSAMGTYLSIASMALGFSGVASAMTVAQILSAVGLAADIVNSNTSVQAETYISYRYKYRDGEGRWSTDPNTNSYYYLGYRTGLRETYKHVMGATLDPDSKLWTAETKNYLDPVRIEKTANYENKTWILRQARVNVLQGFVTDETGW